MRRDAWYSQPIVWLGFAVLAASLAGCLWLIVVSARYQDAPLPAGEALFGVPQSNSFGSTASAIAW
ncbi:MAG: hypothetical protein IT480_02485 [Gammaproteobacteria bacterium]|nr:hypothetical protein [Gammaproteobacteria bacterium]